MSRVTLVAIVFAANLSAQAADERYSFVRDGKLGFIDASGKEVIPAQFQPIGDFAHFSEERAPVDGPDGSGYIDPSGRFVIGPQKNGDSRGRFTTVSPSFSFGRPSAVHSIRRPSSIGPVESFGQARA